MWLGPSITSGDRKFTVPDDIPLYAAGCGIDEDGKKFIQVKGVRWFTNLDHGRRHRPLPLMSMKDNLRYNKKVKGKEFYDKYDNYDAIDVPNTDAIPSDYDGIMGVPITFLDKYSPEQFEVLGCDYDVKEGKLPNLINHKWEGKLDRGYINGQRIYSRLFIKHKK